MTRLHYDVRIVGIWKEAHMYPMAVFLKETTRKIFHMAADGKAKSRQTKSEMAIPAERGYGNKPDDS